MWEEETIKWEEAHKTSAYMQVISCYGQWSIIQCSYHHACMNWKVLQYKMYEYFAKAEHQLLWVVMASLIANSCFFMSSCVAAILAPELSRSRREVTHVPCGLWREHRG